MKLRLFLVDDSADAVSAFTELVTQDGRCEVVGQAGSEQHALDWSFRNDAGFDVAVVDLLLEQGSGFAVLDHMARYQPGKVVVLSEYVSPAVAEKCMALGAVAAFPKSRTGECLEFIRALADAAGAQA